MSGNLERRYRRVLRLLPAYYRERWEEDMVAAFLDSWLTGDPEADAYITRVAGPSWAEIGSVVGLTIRLYLGGTGTPRRYFAWGQAVRGAVLTVVLVHATQGLATLVLTAWSRRLFSWLPAPPPSLAVGFPGGAWTTVRYAVAYAWIVVFVILVLGRYRIARLIAMLTIIPGLVALVQAQVTGSAQGMPGLWAFWLLLDLAAVLGMAAFHRDAPPPPRRAWLLALPANYVLVVIPVLVIRATGNAFWLPDFPGLCCILVIGACLVHTPRARSPRAEGSGVWSLTLMLLAAVAGVYRLVSIDAYLHDPHLAFVSLAELVILIVAVALVAPDAAHAQAATPANPPRPRPHLG